TPSLAVIDYPIHPRPKLRVHRVVKFALPPEIEWKVGVEMREDNVGEQLRTRAFQAKRKLLGAYLFAPGPADMTMRADPCFDMILFGVRVRANHDRSTGVVLRDLENQLCV